jgi:hypothetical protein
VRAGPARQFHAASGIVSDQVVADRGVILDQSLERFTGQRWTVERWLRYWLTTRTSIRPTTLRVYTQHIEQYLISHLGRLRLAEITVRHLTAMFADLAKQTTRTGEPLAPTTLHRICATLRGALNVAGTGCGGLGRESASADRGGAAAEVLDSAVELPAAVPALDQAGAGAVAAPTRPAVGGAETRLEDDAAAGHPDG